MGRYLRSAFDFIILLIFTVLFLFETQVIAHEGHAVAVEASSFIEISARIEEYQSDNFTKRKSERHYFATDLETNNKYEIHFDKKAPKHFKTGNVIKLAGKLIGSDLYLGSAEAENFAAISTSGASSTSATGTAAAVTGVQNTLVILIDSNDSSVSCSQAQVTDMMFNNVSNSVNYMYQDASHKAVSFTGNVYEHVKIDVTSAGACNYSGWGSAAEQALSASGVNTSGYNKKVYVLPPNASCGWAGLGMLGGSGAWIHGAYCGHAQVYAHELGHNLSLHHARTPTAEYGDYSDFMGSGGALVTLNGAHKAFMGWTPTSKIVSGGIGTFTISPLQLDPSAAAHPQLVKMTKPNTGETYYFSYRRPIGYDTRLSSSYYDKLNVHTQTGGYSTFHAALSDGQAYVDSINGLTVTAISHDADSMTFRVDGTCTPNASRMTLSPATQGGAAGQSLNYNITIQNQDSPFCAASQYAMSAVLPAELLASFSSNSISVAAGSSASVTVAVSSAASAAGGNYSFQIAANDSANASHAVSASAAYVIDGQAPTVPLNLTYTISKSKVNLSWSSSSDNVAVTGYEIMRNGVIIATTQSTYFTTSAARRGQTYTFQVRARDSAGNYSAWSSSVTQSK